ncbi:translation elongation factor 2 [Rhodotorula diobovata]|uniref:Ribosome assembly protein 1 n=1 Tax=Rhodotorula diobovata TaxID=5288 RepID=A0A5C5G2H2_9BASI|nr:translation elongation factor 2 [Rhodotorula diobovata]
MSAGPSAIPQDRTRTICIVAHVDHGKSSFADSLLAANGIISSRLAGTIRYLDSREDEQERGITMESSAVSLRWRLPRQGSSGAGAAQATAMDDYKINLIDTPGHVDFSSEVSTASRLCDGAFVLVDAVEGVCTQTVTVLRTVYLSHLRPILVINKLDRLVSEIKLSPIEAYHHLNRIIEDVNAVVGSFYSSERMEEDLRRRERAEAAQARADADADAGADDAAAAARDDEPYEERDDSALYFDPAQGNVVFSSAIDGWAFRIERFAELYAAKLGLSEQALRRCLWGEWYLDPKSKRVLSRKKMEQSGKKLKPLFVQFVLDNIWAVYDSVSLNPNPAKVDKIIASLGVKVRPQDLRAKDTRNLLLSIFSQWLPLAPSAFSAIIDKVPPPAAAQAFRVPRMLHPELGHLDEAISPSGKLEADLFSGNDGPEAYRVAYVSKMFAVRADDLPENQRRQLTADDMRARAKLLKEAKERKAQLVDEGRLDEAEQVMAEYEAQVAAATAAAGGLAAGESKNRDVLIGFARLYSGTVTLGQTLYAVLPKYNADLAPSHPHNARHLAPVKVEQLYMMMGRELLAVKQVQAGNLFAVGGLEGTVLRNATLCGMGLDQEVKEGAARDEDRDCLVNLAGVSNTAPPIVRVALEPQDPSEMSKLVEGLRLLNQADPCVETLVQPTGEHVILTAGELHLERCLKDLRDRFARIEITVSPPIVPFRETAVHGVDMAPPKTPDQPRGTVLGSVQSGLVTFTLRAAPLPTQVTSFLAANASTLKRLQRDRRAAAAGKTDDDAADAPPADAGAAEEGAVVSVEEFWPRLEELLKQAGRDWAGLADQVWAFGPRRVGPNLLVDKTEGAPRSLRRRLERQAAIPSALQTPGGGSSVLTPPKSPLAAPSDPSLAREFASSEFPAGEIDLSTLKQSLTDVDLSSSAMERLPDVRELDENFETAFQLAMNRGPLCAEPVVGMAYFLEAVELNPGEQDVAAVRQRWSNARGQLISAGQDAFRNGLLDWSPRLQLATYSCDIQATGEVLGKVYGVVTKRKGRIVSEEMKEGTAFFTVSALLPVVESFGFADEIRTRTSGAASPQLVFHGYETLDQDPFWVPTTEEELEDLGEKADKENIAKKYMDAVRRRKGMAVDRKVILHAEKQKTMKSA